GLTEERVRRAFAVRDPVPVPQLDDHDPLLGAHRARDRERHREVDVERADGDIHRATAEARRSAPAGSRTGSAAGSPVSAAAASIARPAAASSSALVFNAIATTGTRAPGPRLQV